MNSTVLKVLTSFSNTRCGYYENLTSVFSQAIGFPLQKIYGRDSGTHQPDGNWSGLIGKLNRSEADIAVFPFVTTVERSEAVQFLYPFYFSQVTFVTNLPEYSPQMFAFVNPFSAEVWLATVASIAFMTFVYYFLFRNRYKLSDVAFEVLATVLRQSRFMKSERTGNQLAIATWAIVAMMLSACYVSLLLSVLTVPVLTGVRTIPELAEAIQKGEYRCMVIAPAFARPLLNSPLKHARIIGHHFLKQPVYGQVDDYLQTEGKVAYISVRETLTFLQGRYFISEDTFHEFQGAMATRLDFSLREKLDTVIHRMSAAGIFQKLLKDADFCQSLKALTSETGNADYPRKLTLEEYSGAFIFLAVGHGFACFVLVAEVAFSRMERRKLFLKSL